MRLFKADLHIHTVLSPCGSLDMSPAMIISAAIGKGLDMIAVSDHNTTLHCELMVTLGREAGLNVLRAAEVTSAEEVHSLVILPDADARASFQEWLERHSMRVPYDPRIFGDQVVVDRNEQIICEIEYFLPAALDASLDEIEREAHRLGALFIPAHLDRPSFSITSQLGFIPEDLYIDAVEVVGKVPDILYPVIRNSDAHIPEHIGRRYTTYMMEDATFGELALALRSDGGRKIVEAAK